MSVRRGLEWLNSDSIPRFFEIFEFFWQTYRSNSVSTDFGPNFWHELGILISAQSPEYQDTRALDAEVHDLVVVVLQSPYCGPFSMQAKMIECKSLERFTILRVILAQGPC